MADDKVPALRHPLNRRRAGPTKHRSALDVARQYSYPRSKPRAAPHKSLLISGLSPCLMAESVGLRKKNERPTGTL